MASYNLRNRRQPPLENDEESNSDSDFIADSKGKLILTISLKKDIASANIFPFF